MNLIKQHRAKRLCASFKAAAAVAAGLDELKARPGSKVEYTTALRGGNVVIATNIPTSYPTRGVVTVVSTGYRLIGQGDVVATRSGAVADSAFARNKNPQKVVDFVARYAQKRGLLP